MPSKYEPRRGRPVVAHKLKGRAPIARHPSPGPASALTTSAEAVPAVQLDETVDSAATDRVKLMMMTVPELLNRAKQAIDSGENSLQAAAEDIAAAQEQGATQRQIAQTIGKSAAWVNRL